jgi:glycosyltransferase involved in cell wall biosynthesis
MSKPDERPGTPRTKKRRPSTKLAAVLPGLVSQLGAMYKTALAVKLIKRSRLFDEQWYLKQYEDVARAGLDPAAHYVTHGVREGRDPSPLFQTSFYLSHYLDVAQSGANPLIHYSVHGASEGRDPNPLFDTDWYLSQNPDVAAAGVNPLAHYILRGASEGRDPNPLFDSDWYLKKNPDVAAAGTNPLAHYITEGAAQGRNPGPLFDVRSFHKTMRGITANNRNRFLASDDDPAPLRRARAGKGRGAVPAKAAGAEAQRTAINVLIDKVAPAQPSPFYSALRKIARDCTPTLLPEIARTLNAVDAMKFDAPPSSGPLVSVVMPVHNRPQLVKAAIRSVLQQSHRNFELIVCDDGSTDDTADVVRTFRDKRIKLILQRPNAGAAAARNRCLAEARGSYIAYLDSDNIWHPHYLAVMLEALVAAPGQPMAYASYFDAAMQDGRYELWPIRYRDFSYPLQLDSPFIDLNSIMHHRALYELLGGFDERLRRRQDYDLIAKYAWSRDPQHVPFALNIYRRIPGIQQISSAQTPEDPSLTIIDSKIAGYYRDGIDARIPGWVKKISVLSWDMSGNHFAKAYSVAEALSKTHAVELISFRFFEEPLFKPLADKTPPFEIKSFPGGNFPEFFDAFEKALDAITGDVVYAVKPRLPSFGLALLANHRRGVPVFLEANDLETVIAAPKVGDMHRTVEPAALFARREEAKSPHAAVWSQLLDPMAAELPLMFTHNRNLNQHYASKCLFMRNIKDDTVYDPSLHDRAAVRREFGLNDGDRMILFGGLVREHKGISELVRLLDARKEQGYKLFVVGNRETPELKQLKAKASDRISIFPPQPPERMAVFNLAADAVVLWLDPRVPASHYQMPYKFTDAIAMGTPIVASPVSDLADLGDIVWHVPFGDFDALGAALDRIFTDDADRTRRRIAARKLFDKEFSYRAVRQNLALACALVEKRNAVYPVSEAFAGIFREMCNRFGLDTARRNALLTRKSP